MKDTLLTTNTRVNRAIIFATNAHSNQNRTGPIPLPYIFHPLDVAQKILTYSDLKKDELEIATIDAILHDVIEDTRRQPRDITLNFGHEIMWDVCALSNDPHYKGSSIEKLRENLGRICQRPDRVGCVKLADRASNLKHFPAHWSLEKIRNYIEEAELIAQTLGYCSHSLTGLLQHNIHKCRSQLALLERHSTNRLSGELK